MSVISTVIPPRSFELVRDRIGEILASELRAQYYMTANELFNLKVWRERVVPFGFEEMPAINVGFAGGPYSSQHIDQVEGGYLYNIDCYARAKHTEEGTADELAMLKMQKLLGVCHAIIMDTRYKTLGFSPPFVMNRNITSINIGDPAKQDSSNMVMGRLVLSVRLPENPAEITATILANMVTTVRLYLSDKGYIWSMNNPGDGFDYVLNSNVS